MTGSIGTEGPSGATLPRVDARLADASARGRLADYLSGLESMGVDDGARPADEARLAELATANGSRPSAAPRGSAAPYRGQPTGALSRPKTRSLSVVSLVALALAVFLGAPFPMPHAGGSVGLRRGSVRFPATAQSAPMMRSGVMANSMKAGVAATIATLAVASIGGADAVQWRVEDGGNGHWYAKTTEVLVYPLLRQACEQKGGHLATLTSYAEWQWVKSALPIGYYAGAFAGGYQDRLDPAYAEPNGGWKWVTGEPFVLDLSYMGSSVLYGPMTEPGFDDCPGGSVGLCGCGPSGAQDALFFTGCCSNILDDVGDGIVQNCNSESRMGIIEWSADCNGNGIVDYGEIRAGLVADANANNIPDACECGSFPGFPDCCPGDVVLSGEVNGVDLAALLGAWGTDGGKFPRADIDGSGVVDGADLAVVLSDWGACN